MTRGRGDRLPNFLFVGADKAGSSWLHAVLAAHKSIFLAPEKDLYFFDRYFDRGLPWYARHFAAATEQHHVVGEICHDYLYSPVAADRIADSLAGVRILACLRDPVERAASSYLNMRRSGWVTTDFVTALDEHPHLLDHGRYGTHLARFAERVPAECLHLSFFDELQRHPQGFLDDILDWLGVSRLLLTAEQARPVRQASVARSEPVARFVKAAAVLAREARLERLVGAAKSRPAVNRLLYQPLAREQADAVVTPAARRRIHAELRDDLEACERRFGVDLLRRWQWDVDVAEPEPTGRHA